MMKLTLASKITLCRILAVPLFIDTLLYYRPGENNNQYVALIIFTVAVLTDLVDGFIARSRNQKSQAGAILDPLADKFLLISAYVCLFMMGSLLGDIQLPMWLVVGVISRDVMLLLGAMIIYVVHGDFKIEASPWGKAAAFFQVCTVFGIFLQFSYSNILWYVTIVSIIISSLGYIHRGIKILNKE